MNEATGVLIALAAVVLLGATLLLVVIPEPPERAVVATERLDVAVLEFRNSSQWEDVEETLRSRIESRLVNSDSVDVYSRGQLDTLLMEQALSSGGLLDPKTAVQIGTLTGVTKLITGTVFAVDTPAKEVTVCARWENDECVETIPAVEYTVTVHSQIAVIDARTGKIERTVDLIGRDNVVAEYGELCCGGIGALVATAATDIADRVASYMSSAYTQEIRYGLYSQVEEKRDGYVGGDLTSRFTEGETVYLIAHFTRVEDQDLFDLEWVGPDGGVLARVEDVVDDGDWRLYELGLAGHETGRYWIRGTLNGMPAFETPFSVTTGS